jgi:Beta-lactamase superfamily domain
VAQALSPANRVVWDFCHRLQKRGPTPGTFFHDKGRGNGYILTYGGTRFYIAGDTEGIPEMRALKNIDVAFVPMNLPYTMTPEEAADAVRAFHPRVVYPYHYRGSDTEAFKKALDGTGIDVRLRNWYYENRSSVIQLFGYSVLIPCLGAAWSTLPLRSPAHRL